MDDIEKPKKKPPVKFKDRSIISFDQQINNEPDTIPKIPFTMMINSQKGGGKSTLIKNLILNPKMFYQKFNRGIWISPTSTLDEKIRDLDHYNCFVINTPLNTAILKEKTKSLPKDQAEILKRNFIEDQSIPEWEWKESMCISEFTNIIREQEEIIKKYGKKLADNILIVLDDLAGDSKFYKSDALRKFIFNSRHRKVSIIMTSQSYHSIPKAIRLNNSQLILFETGSEKEMKTIYEENSCRINFKEFNHIFQICTDEAYGFIVINYQNLKTFRFQKMFNEFFVLD